MGDYRITTKADSDLLDIARFTIRKFGVEQARVYKDGLYNCFKALAKIPDLARNASLYAPNLKRYIFKSHTIFFRPEENGIAIVRVLHQKMDFKRYF
ncbi:type II toxin-antitoxin system RelE/ParE family toxin [Pricia sp.]|uniref:type II toxin-antitoxin system RelE/ParE family toxin n=1 Tax=Pricia sp. TaxID=2268138 RepID=UPI0035943C2F